MKDEFFKKQRELKGKILIMCVKRGGYLPSSSLLWKNYYSGDIASTGQTSAQAPQSVHRAGSILKISPSLIASTGHSSIQAPHAMQSSLII
jgi:hypothetical protein